MTALATAEERHEGEKIQRSDSRVPRPFLLCETALQNFVKSSVQGVEHSVVSRLGTNVASVKEQFNESLHYLAATTDSKMDMCNVVIKKQGFRCFR